MSQQSNSLKETFKYKVLAKLKEIPIEETLFSCVLMDIQFPDLSGCKNVQLRLA